MRCGVFVAGAEGFPLRAKMLDLQAQAIIVRNGCSFVAPVFDGYLRMLAGPGGPDLPRALSMRSRDRVPAACQAHRACFCRF